MLNVFRAFKFLFLSIRQNLTLFYQQDTISTFYDISRKEVKELELEITEKDREMEMMEENHQVEIKVWQPALWIALSIALWSRVTRMYVRLSGLYSES